MRAQDILPDTQNEVDIRGTTVRKGTVGAFLANASTVTNPASTPAARDAALHHIEEALPALKALGLFKVLEIREPRLRSLVQARMAATADKEAR